MLHQRAILIAGSLIAFVLQILLAPHIALGYAVPNFLIVYCIVVAIVNPRFYHCLLPFVLGLIYDFISGAPVGSMAFALTAFSYGAAWFYQRANNDTAFMAVMNLGVGLLLIEISYAIILMICGYASNPIEVLIYRTLPCFLYDLFFAVVSYLLLHRFSGDKSMSQPMIKHLS